MNAIKHDAAVNAARMESIASMRLFCDFLEDNPSISLPHGFCSHTEYTTVYDYSEGRGTEENGWIDEKATRAKMRSLATLLVRDFRCGAVTKDFSGDSFTLGSSIGNIRLRFQSDRSAVCKRVVTGTKTIPAYHSPERTEETVEWVCDDPSILRRSNGTNA